MTYWQDWSDDEILKNFNPRVAAPDTDRHLADFTAKAAEARRFYDMRRNVRYGDNPREVYDIFPGIVGGPMHIFIHGGYWRALSKDEHTFVGPPFNGAGATVVLINYPLCPEVSLTGLADSVMRGIAHAISNAADYGGSAERVHISGHSAGAHLAAIAAARDWTQDGLPMDAIKSATLLSGIFDPTVTFRMPIRDELKITEADARANNLLTGDHAPLPHIAVLLAAGGDEPTGWIRQSEDYRSLYGVERAVMLPEGANHFTLLDHVADSKAPLCKAMLGLMR